MSRISGAAAVALVVFFGFLGSLLVFGDWARDSSEVIGPTPSPAAKPPATATPAQIRSGRTTPNAIEVAATPTATPTTSPEVPPVAGVTPVAEFEVTVISAEVPANVRQAPTTEASIVGVIPPGVKAKVVGQVIGEEAFAGSGTRIWYLVKAIPPDLPEDGFVYSSVVVRAEGGQ